MARVAIVTQDIVGKSMAGPAIRSFELARVLSRDHDVTLLTSNPSDISVPSFKIQQQNEISFDHFFQNIDVMITQYLTPKFAYYAKKNSVKIIIDAYCPTMLEVIEIFKPHTPKMRDKESAWIAELQRFSFKFADFIVCASEKQRDFWLGALVAQNLIPHDQYDQDSSLRNFIDVVPFGLPNNPIPSKDGPGPRELFSLNQKDKIVLWGGSLSSWFDPCTLIRAFKELYESRPDIKLIFMGVTHPDPKLPKMFVGTEAIQLAKGLGLLDKTVFFNQNWFPYQQRHNFYRESSIGISIHPEHVETRFSFRTRILDYIWARLPIISTEGDTFADLIKAKELGIVVPYGNEKAIAKAILDLINDPVQYKKCQTNLEELQSFYTWEKVSEPIQKMIPFLLNKQSKPLSLSSKLTIYEFTYKRLVHTLFSKGFVGSAQFLSKLLKDKVSSKMKRFLKSKSPKSTSCKNLAR